MIMLEQSGWEEAGVRGGVTPGLSGRVWRQATASLSHR